MQLKCKLKGDRTLEIFNFSELPSEAQGMLSYLIGQEIELMLEEGVNNYNRSGGKFVFSKPSSNIEIEIVPGTQG